MLCYVLQTTVLEDMMNRPLPVRILYLIPSITSHSRSIYILESVQKLKKIEIFKLMKKKEVEININLNSGKHSSYMLTNDIGINYVKFNSYYTT